MSEVTDLLSRIFPKISIQKDNTKQVGKQIDNLTCDIYNEDCLDTMSRMKDGIIDFIITSPPYDKLRMYHGYSFEFEKIAKELYRVLREGGVLVWVVGDQTIDGSESGTSFKQALYFKDVIGFKLHDTMIYEKINYPPYNHRRYQQCFEYMFVLIKGKLKVFNPIMIKCKEAGKVKLSSTYMKTYNQDIGTKVKDYIVNDKKIKNNIWRYLIGNTNTEGRLSKGHPAVFPKALVKDHMLSWTNEGDLVYDPLLGSGTMGVIAKALNRHFIGSEISPKYCEIAKKRINN